MTNPTAARIAELRAKEIVTDDLGTWPFVPISPADRKWLCDMAERCVAAEGERDGLVKANALLTAGMGSQEELRSDEKQRLRTAEMERNELDVTLDDEQAAHQETLVMLDKAKVRVTELEGRLAEAESQVAYCNAFHMKDASGPAPAAKE